MNTPVYTLRLPEKTQRDLAELSKLYGAPSPRAFAREVLEVMVSGDIERVKAFNARLIAKAGEQMTLKLNAALDGAAAGQKPAKEAKRPKPRGKKGGPHGRAT